MHKVLLLLGMLLDKPLYGYELYRIVSAHGELYADLKKANLYYLLERLASEGDLRVEAEAGTRGARGERLIYELTEQGRAHFLELLRETLLSYEPIHTGIDTAIVFLSYLPHVEGLELLEKRRAMIEGRTLNLAAMRDRTAQNPLLYVAGDHMLSLAEAELAWIDRSLAYLRANGWSEGSQHS